MPPRKLLGTAAQAPERQIAASVLAEQNPPPSLLDVIMEKVLNQHHPASVENDGDHDDSAAGHGGGGGGGYGRPSAAAAAVAAGFEPGSVAQPGTALLMPRHPERPVLSQAVLCGELAPHADAAAGQ